jgi:hypothetical protein
VVEGGETGLRDNPAVWRGGSRAPEAKLAVSRGTSLGLRGALAVSRGTLLGLRGTSAASRGTLLGLRGASAALAAAAKAGARDAPAVSVARTPGLRAIVFPEPEVIALLWTPVLVKAGTDLISSVRRSYGRSVVCER